MERRVDFPVDMHWKDFSPSLQRFSAPERERIERAFLLGERTHGTQKRKSGEPYFAHPVAVAGILIEWSADAETVIAALLHDTVEDTPLTPDDIGREFGVVVRALVEGVTKLTREELENHPTLDEQIETLRKMFSLMQEDVRIMVIKLADRLHNMRTAQFLAPEKQIALARETLDVYVRIAERLCMYDLEQELEALCMALLEPDLFVRLSALKKQSDDRSEHIATEMRFALRETHEQMLQQTDVISEQKSWRRLRQKLENEGAVATGVSSITVVFVCPDVDTCYRMFGALHQLWKRETLSFQDFINAPQINGYRGLHTTVILSDGTRVRCKIRTRDMHRYALNGITMLCFRPASAQNADRGFLDFLPWTKRISSLAEDTKDRSQEFWDSLRSDILGESIIIHGPGDETVMVPKGATTLDGAFYLLKEMALRLATIKVNGQDVPFQAPLKHGDSITVTLGRNPTLQREWLQWTRTGFATAFIRSALTATQTPEEKLLQGRLMLQKIMDERKKGFIEEFNRDSVNKALATIGFASLDEAYTALADGRIDAHEIYGALFEPKADSRTEPARLYTVRYSIAMADLALMDRIAVVHRSFHDFIEEVRYRRPGGVTLKLRITPRNLRLLVQALSDSGAWDMEVIAKRNQVRVVGSIVLLFLLWGLDPVVAHLLLVRLKVAPLDLTIIRFLSLGVMSFLLFMVTKRGNVMPEARLTLRSAWLWLSVILFFFIALSTYVSLASTLPSHYTIPMTAAGIVLTSIVYRPSRLTVLGTWLLFMSGIALLLLTSPDWQWRGILATVFAVISFTAFWLISERYKRRQKVSHRNVQFFFLLSLLCAIMTLPLLPFSTLIALPASVLLGAIAFSVVFVGTPYCLSYVMPHEAVPLISRIAFVNILVTLTGQLIFLGPLEQSTIIAGILVILGSAILIRRR